MPILREQRGSNLESLPWQLLRAIGNCSSLRRLSVGVRDGGLISDTNMNGTLLGFGSSSSSLRLLLGHFRSARTRREYEIWSYVDLRGEQALVGNRDSRNRWSGGSIRSKP